MSENIFFVNICMCLRFRVCAAIFLPSSVVLPFIFGFLSSISTFWWWQQTNTKIPSTYTWQRQTTTRKKELKICIDEVSLKRTGKKRRRKRSCRNPCEEVKKRKQAQAAELHFLIEKFSALLPPFTLMLAKLFFFASLENRILFLFHDFSFS